MLCSITLTSREDVAYRSLNLDLIRVLAVGILLNIDLSHGSFDQTCLDIFVPLDDPNLTVDVLDSVRYKYFFVLTLILFLFGYTDHHSVIEPAIDIDNSLVYEPWAFQRAVATFDSTVVDRQTVLAILSPCIKLSSKIYRRHMIIPSRYFDKFHDLIFLMNNDLLWDYVIQYVLVVVNLSPLK